MPPPPNKKERRSYRRELQGIGKGYGEHGVMGERERFIGQGMGYEIDREVL